MEFQEYQTIINRDIEECLEKMGVQPILFFGSGMSQRYIDTPTWNGLLEYLIEKCPSIDKNIAYYQQKYNSPIEISSEFSNYIREWAWSEQELFPSELFEPDQPSDIYIKHIVSEFFLDIESSELAQKKLEQFSEEINALKAINPFALITTNYDQLLESIFTEFTPIIGQEILRANYASVGEIIKIHGCSSDKNSIVLTNSDYDHFSAKKKYLSAKLLTFFAEHPLIIMGYSAQDPNVRAILSDIDEILSPDNELIPNIYLVEWNEHAETSGNHALEKLIPIDNDRSVRVKSITASCFKWVFDALGSNETLASINPKLLRSVLARTYNLVRHDIPSKTIEVDFQMLEHALSSSDDFAKLYGITNLSNPSALNATYPYSLTSVAAELGYSYWSHAQKLILILEEEHNQDIKGSDNKYHIAVKTGASGHSHKYSQACVDMLKNIRDGQPYEFNP